MTVRIPGFHAMGARKEVTNGKEDACTEACDTHPVCMAADYNQNEESCWVHMKGGEGVCGPLVDSPPVIHYKKYQCGKQFNSFIRSFGVLWILKNNLNNKCNY